MALITDAPATLTATIIQIFTSPALLDTETEDRTNVVVQFAVDGVKAVYTSESLDIPTLITQKEYGVYFGVSDADLTCEYMGETYTGSIDTLAVGEEITFEKEE